MFKKKILSLVLAGIMLLSLSAPAMAVDASGNVGNTPVEVTADAAVFSVTVPTSIPVTIDANAVVACPDNLQVINQSSAPVEITGIELRESAWHLADFNNGDRSQLAKEKVDSNQLGFAFTPAGGNQSATYTKGTQSLNINADEWTVAANSNLVFEADGIATAVKSAISAPVNAVNVIFTVGWKTNSYSGAFLAFSSPSSFTLKTYNGAKNWDGTLEYSTDTTTWTTWDGATTLASIGNVLYLRGTGNTKITGDGTNYRWTLTGSDIACSGNIETLLDYATVQAGGHPTMAKYCYNNMFYGCTSLATAPTLPATTLAYSCYSSMFHDCSNLTTAPALPATALAERCYYYMFYGCTSLTTAPALPATTLAHSCYSNMFEGCTSLTTAPALPATTLADHCYENMFYGCTSLTTAPTLPATTLADYCYFYMFKGCISLTTAPALPATTLTVSCYDDMFLGCTSLKISTTQTGEYTQAYRVPTSGTGQIAVYALNNMFSDTGGAFTGTPTLNTTYYLHSSNRIVG